MAITDYPKADIETHRSIAKWNRRIALVVLVGGLWYSSAEAANPELAALSAVAISAMAYAAATSMRLQALEWEIEEADTSGEADR